MNSIQHWLFSGLLVSILHGWCALGVFLRTQANGGNAKFLTDTNRHMMRHWFGLKMDTQPFYHIMNWQRCWFIWRRLIAWSGVWWPTLCLVIVVYCFFCTLLNKTWLCQYNKYVNVSYNHPNCCVYHIIISMKFTRCWISNLNLLIGYLILNLELTYNLFY